MDVHLFESDGLAVAFDPSAVAFYSVPPTHLRQLRELISGTAPRDTRGDPVYRELLSTFPVHDEPRRSAASGDRIAAYQESLHRLTLILTDRCTLRCRYCYEGSESNPRVATTRGDLDLATIERGLEFACSQYRSIGTIMFFGGEPLLRPDLMREVCGRARTIAHRCGTQIGGFGVITNGTLLTEPVLDLISEESIGVTLSCDGPELVNDSWRVWPSGDGSYRWVEAAARRLQARGIPFGVQASLTPLHARRRTGTREIAAMTRQWTSQAPHITVAQIAPGSRRAWSPRESAWVERMYLEEALRCLKTIESGSLAEVLPFSRLLFVLRSLIWRQASPLRCPAGLEIALAPDGWFYPCFMFAYHGEKLRLTPASHPDAQEYWRRVDSFVHDTLKGRNPQCSTCWARSLCTGCMGSNLAATGTLTGNDEFNCRTTKALAEGVMGYLARVQEEPERWERFRENYRRLCTTADTECT